MRFSCTGQLKHEPLRKRKRKQKTAFLSQAGWWDQIEVAFIPLASLLQWGIGKIWTTRGRVKSDAYRIGRLIGDVWMRCNGVIPCSFHKPDLMPRKWAVMKSNIDPLAPVNPILTINLMLIRDDELALTWSARGVGRAWEIPRVSGGRKRSFI